MKNGNYALRLPASLKKYVEEISSQDGTTMNQFIVTAVAEKVSALKTAEYFTARAKRADLKTFDRIMSRTGGQPPQAGDEIWQDGILSYDEMRFAIQDGARGFNLKPWIGPMSRDTMITGCVKTSDWRSEGYATCLARAYCGHRSDRTRVRCAMSSTLCRSDGVMRSRAARWVPGTRRGRQGSAHGGGAE